MTTLYVSDLDGTLLGEDQQLSEETVDTVNAFIRGGGRFTVATARSWDSAGKLLERLELRLPVILMNGTLVYDPVKHRYLRTNALPGDTAMEVVRSHEASGLRPLVYTMVRDGSFRIYYKGVFNPSERNYIEDRLSRGDRRFRLVEAHALQDGEEVIEINAIGTPDELDEVHARYRKREDVLCHYGSDIYTPGYHWLEIGHPEATKRSALLHVQQLMGAERLVCFGDNLNDLSMFEVADEAYAMGNAHPDVRARATAVLAANAEHGVAKFLRERYAL